MGLLEELILLAGRAAIKAWNDRLSDEEKELLIAASTDGKIIVINLEQDPGFSIQAGGRPLPANDCDPLLAAKYRDAILSLCERGALRHESGVLFTLTAPAMEKGRSLSSTSHPE